MLQVNINIIFKTIFIAMLFHIIGVKEESKPIDNNLDNEEQKVTRYNVDILIESIDINDARRILQIR